MQCHGRSNRVSLCILLFLAFCAVSADSTQAQQPSGAREMAEDAELTDLFFLDSDLGWAVGDRGVVWHTEDGGRQWQLQYSGAPYRLESVHFVDPQQG